MAPISKQTPVSASQTPVAQQPSDLLWKFQLHKEHGQLLAKLDEHQEQLSIFVSDTQKNCERLHARLKAVEKKVDKLDDDDKKLGQESSKLYDQLQALKEKVGLLAKNAEGSGKGHGTSNTSRNQTVTEKAATSHRQTLNTGGIQMPISSNPIPRTSSADTDMTSTLPTEASVALEPRSSIPVKRKHASSELSNFPEPLQQGTSTLREYLLMADRLVADLPPQSTLPRTENEFVRKFVQGLANNEERRTLIIILQQKDLWTVIPSDNGERNILILWSDFKEAVKRSKLLEVKTDTESGSVSQQMEPEKRSQDMANVNAPETRKKPETGPKQKKRRTLWW